MNSFPLCPVPTKPGIYSITNEKTGEIYIGKAVDLRRRLQEWRGVFCNGIGYKNENMARAVQDPCDWSFNILETYDTIKPFELAAREDELIKHMEQLTPALLLNVQGSSAPHTRGMLPSSVILDENGQEISYSEAAKRLGCERASLAKRLAKYRSKGRKIVELEHLAEMNRRFGGPATLA
jgi:hypothetical protein